MPTTTQAAGSTVYIKFTTRTTTGAPTTLAGTPAISVYKNASTTESTAGVTLTVDFDARTGLNHVSIDTSADGTFYANGNSFQVVITTGTVGGVSVVGEVVGNFDLVAAVTVPTVAQIATGVWQDTTAGDFTTAGSIGKSLFTSGNVPGTLGGLFIDGTNTGLVACRAGMTISSTTGNALLLISTGGNGDGLAATGNGAGHGIHATSAGAGTGITANMTGNITGNLVGTVSTTTNLTNLPTIPNNWLTAAGIAAGALNGKGDWSTYAGGAVASVTGDVGGNVVGNVNGSVNSVATPVTTGGYSTGQDPATLVLDVLQSGHLGAGTIGLSIATAAGLAPLAGQSFSFPMKLISDDSLAPGVTVTATRITDSAAPVACTNAVTEIGGGFYSITFSIADLTYTNDVTFIFAAALCKDTIVKQVAT